MKTYTIKFLPTAEQDLRTSFLWGINVWGKTQASKWLRNFYAACKKHLKQFPESCPIAPESDEFERELRQLVIERYRVIFTIKDDTVFVLYVRGAYVGSIVDDVDELE